MQASNALFLAILVIAVGAFTAILAAVIYALPPVIRLVDVGIRGVSATVIEATVSRVPRMGKP